MKPVRRFRPGLQDCELEDRFLLATANPGTIVLTTSGFVLTTPFAGASLYSGSSFGGVGGTPIPTSFFITGSGGISSIQPSSPTGVATPTTPGTTSTSGAASQTISVGSGANDATAASIPLVSRNVVAFDTPSSPPRIGRPSGDRSPVLPAGQVYRAGIPTPPAPAAPEPQGNPTNPSPSTTYVHPSPIPRGDAPRLVLS
jgi:hypothetical protein